MGDRETVSEIIGRDSTKGRQIRDYIGADSLRQELFKVLSDGRWHSTLELWRRVKKYGQYIGLVRIGKILSQFQAVSGEDVLERREGLDISEWRITPLFNSLVSEIIQTLPLSGEKTASKESESEETEEANEDGENADHM
jgi:hypothetical protein